jgi:hypothetical protein
LVEKKILGGVFKLFGGNFVKKGFFRLFLAKIGGLFTTSSIYSESEQKILPENVHFLSTGFFRKILGEKLKWSGIQFIQKKNTTTIFRNYLHTIDVK